jgi:ribonucleoside-triphosphate reductase
MSYITEEFDLASRFGDSIRSMPVQFGFNGFGEIVYYRSYSRIIRGDFDEELGQEDWADTVLRNINGVMSIRKDWYIRNRIQWDEAYWQEYAFGMAGAMQRMEWMPPGRGLWAMGSDIVRDRGAMALYNCAFSEIGEDWVEDLCWIKDTLMHGVGVGFRPIRTQFTLQEPQSTYAFVIPDTREGWVDAMRRLLISFKDGTPKPEFFYDLIRPFGSIIKTFGGTASGPDPLKRMLETMENLCYKYIRETYDPVRFFTDLANLVGVCVVSGNVRRSAEIALCEMSDPIFMDLKNYERYPYRSEWGWMSNNSILLEKDEDFENLDEIAQANIDGHDVGYLNMRNVPYGRLGKRDSYPLDAARGLNPCGEIPLEHREVCNLAETVPTRCVDVNRWLAACRYATFYCSTVTLLPTHQPTTNRIVAKNRRIGVSLMDFTGWKEQEGTAKVISYLRKGYNEIRKENARLADEAGIPHSNRVTTVKPGGTTPKVAGKSPGASYPTFHYTLRRLNVGHDTPIDKVLMAAGVPYQESVYTPKTRVYEYPIEQGPAPPATDVSLWEQAFNLVLLQREWSDNAVSNTLYFKPRWSKIGIVAGYNAERMLTWFTKLNSKEVFLEITDQDLLMANVIEARGLDENTYRVQRNNDDFNVYRFNPDHEENIIEAVLSHIAPLTKSVSLLPHSEAGIYPQMPEEGITKEEHDRRLAGIKPIDWTQFGGSDGTDEKYCTGDTCQIVR